MDHAPPEVARRNLADLTRINRRFGGHSVIKQMLGRVVPKNQPFTLLDIGAASGDTAEVLQPLYRQAVITSLDYNVVNLSAAPAPKLIGDAFSLPFREGSFDYVLCSLFLHHFTDDHVIGLLKSFYAVARQALFVCDLERSIFPYYFLPLTKPICRWDRLTVHDGMISVRAAFRKRELRDLAKKAGIQDARVKAYRPAFRLSLFAKK